MLSLRKNHSYIIIMLASTDACCMPCGLVKGILSPQLATVMACDMCVAQYQQTHALNFLLWSLRKHLGCCSASFSCRESLLVRYSLVLLLDSLLLTRRDALNGLHNDTSDAVWVTIRSRTTVLKVALTIVGDCARNSD